MSDDITDRPDGPEHDASGFFIGGPKFITASDVLAKLIAEQHCAISASTPENERKRHVVNKARNSQRRRYAEHGVPEFLRALRVA